MRPSDGYSKSTHNHLHFGEVVLSTEDLVEISQRLEKYPREG